MRHKVQENPWLMACSSFCEGPRSAITTYFTGEENESPRVKETCLRSYNQLREEGLEFYLSIPAP